MTTMVASLESTQDYLVFKEKVESLAGKAVWLVSLPSVVAILLALILVAYLLTFGVLKGLNRAALKNVRLAFECLAGVGHDTKGFDEIKNMVQEMRRTLTEARDASTQAFFFWPLTKSLDNCLLEWDELAENIAISTDADVRDLVKKIADAL